MQARVCANVRHMEDGYTQLGTVLTDRRPEDSEGDSVIVLGRFKGDPYDGVQLSYDAGRRNLYLTPEGALRLAILLAAAVARYPPPWPLGWWPASLSSSSSSSSSSRGSHRSVAELQQSIRPGLIPGPSTRGRSCGPRLPTRSSTPSPPTVSDSE